MLLFVVEQLDIHMSMSRKEFSAMVYMVLEQFLLQLHHKTIWKREHESSHDQDCQMKWREGLIHATHLYFVCAINPNGAHLFERRWVYSN
jgi:hypothetical protein